MPPAIPAFAVADAIFAGTTHPGGQRKPLFSNFQDFSSCEGDKQYTNIFTLMPAEGCNRDGKQVMSKNLSMRLAAGVATLMVFLTNPASAQVTFDWATVGNPGNAADNYGLGSVAYEFRIAKHEVTNDQYVQFLNAVAATDTNALYSSNMGSDTRGGIIQSGLSGSLVYAAKANMGNKPVNYVSFLDAIRFVNWLHNGQPAGAQDAFTTEEGVYTISDGISETRRSAAKFFVPTENEWYKAAYDQPSGDGGDVDNYWRYPTASNDVPTIATATPTGDIGNPGTNVANYDFGADWNEQDGNVTTVGSAGALSESFYGTFDQGGNLKEWNETVAHDTFRVLRGGSWNSGVSVLRSSFQNSTLPTLEFDAVGFRVASPIPTCTADLDGDGDVDLEDFGSFQVQFTAFAQVSFEWATIENLDNAADPLNEGDIPGIGSVGYEYRIAKHEVTNDQYAEFLNAVAATDPNGLYTTFMGSDVRSGLRRGGDSGSFTYHVKSNMDNKPVNYVSFFDAMRFVNWLHNGRPTGAQDASTTEDGVYTISDALSETRRFGARFFIPTENEWYKAAYHQPSANGGDIDDYWLYPTASNSVPTIATANATGDISNPGTNVANYARGADWNGENGHVTTVGSAGPLSESFYGTSGQGGNVWEWNETLVSASSRGSRGGSWTISASGLRSSFQFSFDPSLEGFDVGFRIASPSRECSADLDGDGDVDLLDFGLFQGLLTDPQ